METTYTDITIQANRLMGDYTILIPSKHTNIEDSDIRKSVPDFEGNDKPKGLTYLNQSFNSVREFALPLDIVECSIETIGEERTSEVMSYISEHASNIGRWDRSFVGKKGRFSSFASGLVKILQSDYPVIRSPDEIVGHPITKTAVEEISSLGWYESPLPKVDKARVKELVDIEEAEFSERSLRALEAGRKHGFGAYQFVLDLKK